MGEEDIKKIIGFGKPCDKCKECYEFKHKGCRGMSQICFGYHKEKEIAKKASSLMRYKP